MRLVGFFSLRRTNTATLVLYSACRLLWTFLATQLVQRPFVGVDCFAPPPTTGNLFLTRTIKQASNQFHLSVSKSSMSAVGAQQQPASSEESSSLTSPYYSYSHFSSRFVPLSLLYNGIAKLFQLLMGKKRSTLLQSLPAPNKSNTRKVAIVTGSNVGIGFETAKTLVVKYEWDVILACRSRDKAVRAAESINQQAAATESTGKAVFLQPLDLSDFDSVRAFAAKLRDSGDSKYQSIDVLVNNAGSNMSGQASGKFDFVFQTNFLGHFLLTNLLMQAKILKKGGSRVINLASVMHHFTGRHSLTPAFWREVALFQRDRPVNVHPYSASKLAAILFTIELNRRYGQSLDVSSRAVNPGSVMSEIWRDYPSWKKALFRLFYLTPQQGCMTTVAACLLEDSSFASESSCCYLQPYWIPSSPLLHKDEKEAPPFPAVEMLGPFVGYRPTPPRLPPDGGASAAQALWNVSEELTECDFSKVRL